MSACNNLGKISIGDSLDVTAFYNMSSHTPMLSHDGELHPVMGIAIMYTARPRDEAMKEILADKGPDRTNRPPPPPEQHHHHR